MAIVKAGPNEFLLVGRGGKLQNRGSAVQTFVRPGTVSVLVPSTKHEAAFEFTQETKDGIPLRFKGIIVYRITDPLAAARQFDFSDSRGVDEITRLLTHVCLGELRHAVSHMTMTECIEQRKTTLSTVAESALAATINGRDGTDGAWGITVEVAQLAQVFIVDTELRRQLESEVRNEIKLKSDQSDLRAAEEARLTQLASDDRIAEQKLGADREALRRDEELEVARVARERRMLVEKLATDRQAIELEQERFHAQVEVDRDRIDTETPVRLHELETQSAILRQEVDVRELRNRVKGLDVEHDMLLPRSQQALRREILPLEQAPEIVRAASRVLNGTTLSIYGEDGAVVGQLAPILEVLGRAVQRATAETVPATAASSTNPD
jgi:SPFH domain/Band 7 family protein